MNQKHQSINDSLRSLSTQDFLNFGIRDVAYIRPVTLEEKEAFMIHAADGTPLSVMESYDTALITVRHNELQHVTLH